MPAKELYERPLVDDTKVGPFRGAERDGSAGCFPVPDHADERHPAQHRVPNLRIYALARLFQLHPEAPGPYRLRQRDR